MFRINRFIGPATQQLSKNDRRLNWAAIILSIPAYTWCVWQSTRVAKQLKAEGYTKQEALDMMGYRKEPPLD